MATKWWHQVEETTAEWHELKTDEGLVYFHNVRTNETQWDRPKELMTIEDESRAGAWLWLPDPTDCFVPARLEKPGSPSSKATLRAEDGRVIMVAHKEVNTFAHLQWPSLQRIVADLTLLDDMNPALILHNLKTRFERDQIYTNIGTILISVNPYCRLDLYSPDVIDDYENRGVKEMPPHVYNIAHNAIQGIKDSTTNQSVIVSGESGAGKTEATKQVLSYIAAVSGSMNHIEDKILLANPILETFGNAKTIRNNNSSRFGKYIQVYLNNRGEISGAKTLSFLLEKVRVVCPAPGERNFHIFYQLTEGIGAAERSRLGVGRADQYFYTIQGECTQVNGIDDRTDYRDMLKAMDAIGMSEGERDAILQCTAAILHLGNVVFETTGDEQCRVANEDELQWAADLFGVDILKLAYVMTKRTLQIRGQGDTCVFLSEDQAFEARDALAKFVYGAMFETIVARVNVAMRGEGDGDAKLIGILDIFGFEVFDLNSFEQLCINFTNERLQQLFNANTFALEEGLYAAEGVAFDHIDYIDNQPMVDLLTKSPFGIMNLLDEEVVVPQGSDAKFLHKIKAQHISHGHYQSGTSPTSFVIIHYAGPVHYDVIGFLEKNRDTLTPDAMQLMISSGQAFVASLFVDAAVMTAKARKLTLGKQFRNQLDNLMVTLKATTPHYIRCIKPNEIKASRTFVSKNCYQQLLYSGVFEAVQIRKKGFPFRQKHPDFLLRYQVIFPDRSYSSCKELIKDLALNEDNIRIGRSMILYRSEEYKSIELRRSIMVRKKEIVLDLTELMKENPNELPNDMARERYFERLSKAVRTANEFQVDDPIARRGKDVLIAFIESRMDDETKSLLESAQLKCDREALEQALARSDSFEYNTKLVRQCKKLLGRIARIEEEGEMALLLLERDHMAAVVQAATDLGYWTETVSYYEQLLQLSPMELLKVQLKQAIAVSNVSRGIRLTIKMKESVLAEQSDMFELTKCGIIKKPEHWAGEKFLSMHRDKLRQEMLRWTESELHAPLTLIPEGPNHHDITITLGHCFRLLQEFMGDRKTDKKPFLQGLALVELAHGRPELRNEVYVQTLKQLTMNPNMDSVRKGWQILGGFIASFPPSDAFENFLEVWLRVNAQNEDYLGALQGITYSGARTSPIDMTELDNIAETLRERRLEYAEHLPSGPPSYEDLMMPFDTSVDELEFRRKAPKTVAATRKPQLGGELKEEGRKVSSQATKFHEFQRKTKGSLKSRMSSRRPTPWQAIVDPSSGSTYYWNSTTGESTWEIPPDLKFGVAEDVKPRF